MDNHMHNCIPSSIGQWFANWTSRFSASLIISGKVNQKKNFCSIVRSRKQNSYGPCLHDTRVLWGQNFKQRGWQSSNFNYDKMVLRLGYSCDLTGKWNILRLNVHTLITKCTLIKHYWWFGFPFLFFIFMNWHVQYRLQEI